MFGVGAKSNLVTGTAPESIGNNASSDLLNCISIY
jgi:hypothetical protein